MSFKAFLLSLLIILCGLFIYFKSASLGSEDSYFNRVTRYQLGRYGVMRFVLGLHKDGDARADYLLNKNLLTIEVVHAQSVDVPAGALDDFMNKVRQYTGRNVRVIEVDVFQDGMLSDQDMDGIVDKYRRHSSWNESNFFVMYAQDFQGGENEIGRTYKEFGAVLSADRLNRITSGYSSAKKSYVVSTLLHEFGHQMGLDHISNPNCIMHEDVESPSSASSFASSFTMTDFCSEELDNLQTIKTSLQ